jgi:hypothetical protein
VMPATAVGGKRQIDETIEQSFARKPIATSTRLQAEHALTSAPSSEAPRLRR